jgi:hypothetical protein
MLWTSYTHSSQTYTNWGALEVIIDKGVSRNIIRRLKQAGAEGVIVYPLNSVIY